MQKSYFCTAMKEIARLLIFAGGLLLIGGVLLYFFSGKLKWFGSLPGDIRIEKPGLDFYMPITSMLLASVVLSAIIWIIRRYF